MAAIYPFVNSLQMKLENRIQVAMLGVRADRFSKIVVLLLNLGHRSTIASLTRCYSSLEVKDR